MVVGYKWMPEKSKELMYWSGGNMRDEKFKRPEQSGTIGIQDMRKV